MKKFFYLLVFPLLIFSFTAFGFSHAEKLFFSSAETQVISEKDSANEELEEETGEFDEMHEFAHFQKMSEETAAEEVKTPAPERFPPESLQIPGIDVDGPVEEVGILENGQMGVPDSAEGIGWFAPGVKPGEQGNAVLAGHVDSRSGPAVFYDLKEMSAGDEVQVTDNEGNELTFEVTRVVSYDRKEAPLEEIFGRSEKRNLNLITCTGTFNQEEGTHDERLVVYTELVEEESDVPALPEPSSPEEIDVRGSVFTWHAVSENDIVGYRVYEVNEDEEDILVQSVAAYERKSYTSETVGTSQHYVTAVNEAGIESPPSEMK
ncbi:class F sortase [Alkalicoccus daliensis]|uniref:LPXTG-site transpeptidase (Sortase) family protein n=1 Tax=Alkalicoccus daliensis TaxID=745820 RepID=A0A1G9ZD32_9BACI|nr:class F sortase [Alkalicoccus daliensis]SDN19027.1 LPXTG-site transpeptidase (sortase) family protein [Alkalicoccus daliensis]